MIDSYRVYPNRKHLLGYATQFRSDRVEDFREFLSDRADGFYEVDEDDEGWYVEDQDRGDFTYLPEGHWVVYLEVGEKIETYATYDLIREEYELQ